MEKEDIEGQTEGNRQKQKTNDGGIEIKGNCFATMRMVRGN